MVYSGAWGKLIHEKNQKQKSRDTAHLSNGAANTPKPAKKRIWRLSHLAGHPVGTQLAEAQRRGDFPKEGHHIHMLDETLQ